MFCIILRTTSEELQKDVRCKPEVLYLHFFSTEPAKPTKMLFSFHGFNKIKIHNKQDFLNLSLTKVTTCHLSRQRMFDPRAKPKRQLSFTGSKYNRLNPVLRRNLFYLMSLYSHSRKTTRRLKGGLCFWLDRFKKESAVRWRHLENRCYYSKNIYFMLNEKLT